MKLQMRQSLTICITYTSSQDDVTSNKRSAAEESFAPFRECHGIGISVFLSL